MNIAEMHVWFRQYAQQMGMQNVRAILPEEIDVLINTSISDIVNQLVRENVGVRNDRVIADITKLNQVNALRSLYKVVELDMASATPFMEFNSADVLTGKMSNKYDNAGSVDNVSTTVTPEYLYLVDFSLNYKSTKTGYTGTHAGNAPIDLDNNQFVSTWFPVRIIDHSELANTLNDFILKSRLRTPILVVYNDDTYDLYISRFKTQEYESNTYYVLEHNLVPNKLRMSYIAIPNVVKYASDIDGENVDCNLPENIHIDILKHAVDLYMISVRGGSYNQQTQQQEVNSNANTSAAGNYQS